MGHFWTAVYKMAAKDFERDHIDVVNLHLDSQNPRFEEQDSSREVLVKLVLEQGRKLFALAEHIAERGSNPAETPIVVKDGKKGYIVLEGNRRVAAIKLVTEPKLVDSIEGMSPALAKRFKALNKKYGDALPMDLLCAVAPNREEAREWIELRHTGENEGVGVIQWTGVATARFRGETPENQLLEVVKDSDFLDAPTTEKLSKISITNLERLLGTPEARRLLGIDVKRKQLSFLEGVDHRRVIGRLAIVVSDIANKHFKVSQLDTKEQREAYAKAVAARRPPAPGKKIAPTVLPGQPTDGKSKAKRAKSKSPGRSRKTLIPITLKLHINQPRVAQIFGELQKLKIDGFLNSGAVLLRVIVEMSVDEYSKKHRLPLVDLSKKHRPALKLKTKVLQVAKHLEKTGNCDKSELYGIRTLANTKDTVFSIDTWHSYIHNPHYSPTVKELITNWDNIQPFFENLWA